jgi:cytochrome c-type biogenesis protein CcmH
MNASTDWVSAIAILAAGLILGVLFMVFSRRRNARTLGGDPDLERKDLEAKRDALVLQLRDPSIGVDERQRLENETADVLRRLDAFDRSAAAPATAAPRTSGMDPAIKGFLWGATSVAALAALGYFVMQQATPRQEGQEVTGGMAAGRAQQPQAAPDPMVQQLEAAVRNEPANLQLRNDLAQAYLNTENLMGVFEQTKFVLAKQPNDSRALTYQSIVRMAMGEREEAQRMLQRATELDPKNLDGWVALAWVYAQTNRMADAERTIAQAVKQAPEEKGRLEALFAQMKGEANAPQQASNGGLPEGHPSIDGASTPGRSAIPTGAGGAAAVRVTLDLDASAKQRSGIVFVIARNPAGGPPVAVKRVIAASFPVNVELTSADSMMGQQLPATFRIEARLDADGDPLTKPPSDPSGMQNGVTPGASVRFALR